MQGHEAAGDYGILAEIGPELGTAYFYYDNGADRVQGIRRCEVICF